MVPEAKDINVQLESALVDNDAREPRFEPNKLEYEWRIINPAETAGGHDAESEMDAIAEPVLEQRQERRHSAGGVFCLRSIRQRQ